MEPFKSSDDRKYVINEENNFSFKFLKNHNFNASNKSIFKTNMNLINYKLNQNYYPNNQLFSSKKVVKLEETPDENQSFYEFKSIPNISFENNDEINNSIQRVKFLSDYTLSDKNNEQIERLLPLNNKKMHCKEFNQNNRFVISEVNENDLHHNRELIDINNEERSSFIDERKNSFSNSETSGKIFNYLLL
jgi:hypothetical protein